MNNPQRRQFLADVGRGVLAASVGTTLCADLGLGSVRADEKPKELNFGKLESLVALMQETPAAKLLPLLAKKLKDGTEIRELVAAGALANARTFGGEDYVGFHTMMALSPAYHMSKEMPEKERALPVFKVLYRNAEQTQKLGGRKNEVLRQVDPGVSPGGALTGEEILKAVKKKDAVRGERILAGLEPNGPDKMLDELLTMVEDCQEVHRIVLPYRAWDLLSIVGKEHAHTMLRQSVRFCAKSESAGYSAQFEAARRALPGLLETAMKPGKRTEPPAITDTWIDRMANTIFKSTPQEAAQAVAEAIAEGFPVDAIGEALSLATNYLVLRDNGRQGREVQPNKPEGSVHGDSIGVHACDSANAWRNLARVAGKKNQAACLILGGWQAARDRTQRGGDFLNWEAYPRAEARARVKGTDARTLLDEAEDAIKNKDQALASAAVAAYGAKGLPARAVFDLLLKYSVSEDGALHAEKYYRTAVEEFTLTRAAFRWRHPIALARVVASSFGYKAPGHAEACKLLKA